MYIHVYIHVYIAGTARIWPATARAECFTRICTMCVWMCVCKNGFFIQKPHKYTYFGHSQNVVFHCASWILHMHIYYVCMCVLYIHTLIFIMTVFFFLDKKNSSSNSGAKTHRFGLCSQRSVSIFFYAKKKTIIMKMRVFTMCVYVCV